MKMGSMLCGHCKQWHRSSSPCDCEGARTERLKPYIEAIERDRLKTKQPTVDHEAFRNDMIAVMDKHAGALDSAEMMALAAYTTGQIMAMQDARKWSPELAMEIVAKNIEAGNAQAIADAHRWMPKA